MIARWSPFLLALALGGCASVQLRQTGIDVALYRSETQNLVVTSAAAQPLSLDTVPGAAPVQLAPGQSLTIPFQVMTVGTARRVPGEPYWAIAPAGFAEFFVEKAAPKRVDASSPVLALRFRDARGELVKATFSVIGCGARNDWARDQVRAADHAIQVPDPIPSVAQKVCP